MNVAIPKEGSQSFAQSLKSSDELKELDIQTTKLCRRDTKKGGKAVLGMKIHCVGKDRYVEDCNTGHQFFFLHRT